MITLAGQVILSGFSFISWEDVKMAEKLSFDTGVREYEINDNGILRFNPSDPNVYKRFKDLYEDIRSIESEIEEKSQGISDGMETVDLLVKYDALMKSKLSYVFGEENDFDKLLGGVNLMAVTRSGNMVVVNLMDALKPIIEQGVKAYAKTQAALSVEKARQERAKR